MHPDEQYEFLIHEDELKRLQQEKNENQLKWDRRFLALAEHIAQWSKDPSSKVAAIIVDKDKRIVSLGYNGFPKGIADERLDNREEKYLTVVHAEVNAILFANQSIKGCTIYLWPYPSCLPCTSIIIQSGIKRVVSPKYPEPRWVGDWFESFPKVKERYKEAKIELVEI